MGRFIRRGCTTVLIGGVIMILFVAWLLGACFGDAAEEEQAEAPEEESTEEPTEESTEESTEETRERARSTSRASEAAAQPEPQTPQERIRAALTKPPAMLQERDIKDVQVFSDPTNGCTRVRIDFQSITPETIEWEMESIYTVLYGDQPLGTQVCSVEANAFGTAKDDYGHPYEELLYSTRLGSDQAARINWNTARTEGVNFPRIWTLNYKSPKVEQAEDKFEMERAIDCAVDEGIFDNWLCPR